MRFATRTIHWCQPSDPSTGALMPPIFQTSTFEQESPGVNLGFDYSRTNNPTRQRLEQVLAELEGVDHAASLNLRLTLTDTTNLGAVARAVTSSTRLVWLETPTNPRLLVSDIRAIADLAHAKGALVVVDNTFATPVLQRPFELGADLVVHSVTKYLAGHSDLIQGAVLARDAAVFQPVKFLQNAIGAVPAPLDCWLTLRGLKTLELRVQRHTQNAARIAQALASHPRVRRVYYPGLPAHPGHEVARRQMSGFGGMVSFELDGSRDRRASCPISDSLRSARAWAG